MNYKIKCGNCKKVFNFKSDKKENLPEFVFCNFCNKKNKVNIKNKANLVTSIKCRKCSISLDENIIPNKNLVRCFKCGAMNSRTPSSKDKNLTNSSSNKKEKINKKYRLENNLLEIDGVRELYTDEDGHLATYEEWDYGDPDL